MSSKKFFLSATAFLAFASTMGVEKVATATQPIIINCPTTIQAATICPSGAKGPTGKPINNVSLNYHATWFCFLGLPTPLPSGAYQVTSITGAPNLPHGACRYNAAGGKMIGYLIPTFGVKPPITSCNATNNKNSNYISCQ